MCRFLCIRGPIPLHFGFRTDLPPKAGSNPCFLLFYSSFCEDQISQKCIYRWSDLGNATNIAIFSAFICWPHYNIFSKKIIMSILYEWMTIRQMIYEADFDIYYWPYWVYNFQLPTTAHRGSYAEVALYFDSSAPTHPTGHIPRLTRSALIIWQSMLS